MPKNRMPAVVVVAALLLGSMSTAAVGSQREPTKKQSVALSVDSFDRWELRTAPLAMLARWFSLELSYRANEHWSVGPSLISYSAKGPYGNMLMPTWDGYATGAHLYYFGRSAMTNSVYLGVRGLYESYVSYPHAALFSEAVSGVKAQGAVGYQKRWSSVGLLVGLGAEQRFHRVVRSKESALRSYDENESFPFFEFKLGLQF